MKIISIPYYNKHNTTNKESLKKAIKILSDDYMINNEVMEIGDKLDLLECIVDLTNIYLYIENKD